MLNHIDQVAQDISNMDNNVTNSLAWELIAYIDWDHSRSRLCQGHVVGRMTFENIYLYNEEIKKPCYFQIAQKVLNRFASK